MALPVSLLSLLKERMQTRAYEELRICLNLGTNARSWQGASNFITKRKSIFRILCQSVSLDLAMSAKLLPISGGFAYDDNNESLVDE
jgi:hypothetical protein